MEETGGFHDLTRDVEGELIFHEYPLPAEILRSWGLLFSGNYAIMDHRGSISAYQRELGVM
jgi:hypothetical protein